MKTFRAYLRESLTLRQLKDALDETPPEGGADAYPKFLHLHGISYTELNSLDRQTTIYSFKIEGKPFVLEDGDDRVRDAYDWLEAVDPEAWVDMPDFSREFWQSPSTLYHATQTNLVPSILKNGLNATSQSRGMGNRSVGGAVFTVTDVELLSDGSYGNSIFEIDAPQMKRDGRTPTVEREPSIVEYEAREALAARVSRDIYLERSSDYEGEWADTVIVHGSIAAKYLRLMD